MKKTVVVGMSGGVDSSVAAKLLLDAGYNVIGLFMNNWDDDGGNGECSSADDFRDAQDVSGRLGIPCYSVNFSKEYMERVFEYFLSEYKKGRTPNPDVLCNREIKFGPFRDFAKKLNADYIATGHYCNIRHEDGDTQLLVAADAEKDQTYFLNQVRTEQLRDVLFPIGGLNKPEVRAIAKSLNLVTAGKKDSTGICFIGERKFKQFLANYLPAQKGRIVDLSGREIGVHDGLMYYTLGQRKGLGIGGLKDADAGRRYVVEKNLEKNELVVACGDGEELLSAGLVGSGLNIIGSFGQKKFECKAKCRYRQTAQNAEAVIKDDGIVEVIFEKKQRAVTPGQYVVLYIRDRCLGGAVIESAL